MSVHGSKANNGSVNEMSDDELREASWRHVVENVARIEKEDPPLFLRIASLLGSRDCCNGLWEDHAFRRLVAQFATTALCDALERLRLEEAQRSAPVKVPVNAPKARRFRHKDGFTPDLDYIEIIGDRSHCVLKNGTREISVTSLESALELVARGTWVEVTDEPAKPAAESQPEQYDPLKHLTEMLGKYDSIMAQLDDCKIICQLDLKIKGRSESDGARVRALLPTERDKMLFGIAYLMHDDGEHGELKSTDKAATS